MFLFFNKVVCRPVADSTFHVHWVLGLTAGTMALVLLAAVSYQCAATWRWLKEGALRGWEEGLAGAGDLQAAVRISHSLPDLKRPTRQEYVQEAKGDKKVRMRKGPRAAQLTLVRCKKRIVPLYHNNIVEIIYKTVLQLVVIDNAYCTKAEAGNGQ